VLRNGHSITACGNAEGRERHCNRQRQEVGNSKTTPARKMRQKRQLQWIPLIACLAALSSTLLAQAQQQVRLTYQTT